jgi:hypothetical protein
MTDMNDKEKKRDEESDEEKTEKEVLKSLLRNLREYIGPSPMYIRLMRFLK